jgi:transcriptional regulator with XRE-family HTH domain
MRLGRQKDSALEGDQLVGVGRRITEARLEAGMTKMELAEKLGVPLGLFERYEAGGEDPSPHLGRLAQVTGKPVTWFRGEAPGEGGEPDDTAAAEAEAEPEVIEPDEEPVLLPESEPVGSNGGSSEPDETTVEPLVLGEPDPEPGAEPDEPLPPASEPEPEPEPEVSSPPAAASAASMADDGDDDLDRLLSSLGRQREQMAARRKELDEREQALAGREADLERRDQELSDRALQLDDRETDLSQREGALGEQASAATAQLDADWHEKLQSFEDTNRQYAQAAAALADWASELRNTAGAQPSSASASAEPESEPFSSSSSSSTSGDDFPEDF